jgi:hypothetical protein
MHKILALVLLGLAPCAARAEEALTPLKLSFPPPILTGTPVPAKLRIPQRSARPDFDTG